MSRLEFLNLVSVYDSLYTYISFFIILLFSYYFYRQKEDIPPSLFRTELLIVFGLTIYFGTYPYFYGTDRYLYVSAFLHGDLDTGSERLWMLYTDLFRPFFNEKAWLLLTAFLYCSGFWIYSKKMHSNYVVVMLMGFLGFLFLKAYGVNTMRSGAAASCVFYALTWRERNIWVHYLILFCVINIHFSMALPALALLVTNYYKSSKTYFYFWLLCIPLSFLLGNYFQILFEPYLQDFSEGKSTGYLLTEDRRYNSGFRWDFLFYSIVPVLLAYYYIYRKGIDDFFYKAIFNTYLFVNSFWILIIRANFSDRMAYLSWMFIPILLLYPPLKYEIWSNQNTKISLILLGQALFTFILNTR